MKNKITTLVSLLVLTGCAQFTTKQSSSDTPTADGSIVRTVTTDARAISFLAGKQALAGWKANQTANTQGASLAGVEQESDLSKLVEAAMRAYIASQTGGMLKSAPPEAPLNP